MLHEFSRMELLIGADALKKLKESNVAVFGIGGVGSYTVEGLVRAGVGSLVLVDDDTVCLTNINRQLHATRKTVGRVKVDVMKERILEINPKAEVETYRLFYLPDTAETIAWEGVDYIVDAMDTVSAKLDLVERAIRLGIPLISCMGAGNKLDPTRFEVADIYDTSVCPLCKVMRSELKKRNVPALKVVYSKEPPVAPLKDEVTGCAEGCICPKGTTRKCTERRSIPGSISFVPSVAGLIMAGEVVKDLIARV
jgi:tRNA A37 threonylcarbamoyladenosine dehydratase